MTDQKSQRAVSLKSTLATDKKYSIKGREKEREKQRIVWRRERERKWGEKERGPSNSNKTGPT